MAYKAPIWEDGKSPAISAENLNNLSQAAEGAQVLCGNSAPTSSTEGAVGQFYLVVVADSDGNYPLYQCVAIANGSYTWRDTRRIPDSITSMLGIPAPGTINRALNVLANIGNLHVWERVQTNQAAGYTLGEAKKIRVSSANAESYIYATFKYSSEITVNEDGSITLVSPITLSVSGDNFSTTDTSVLKDKYVVVTPSEDTIYDIDPNSVYKVVQSLSLNQASITWGYNYNLILNSAQLVTGHPAGTTTDYLTSTDPNAYPKQSAEGGQDAYYTLGDVVSGNVVAVNSSSGTYVKVKHSSTLDVSEDGTISFPTTATTTEVKSTNSSNKESDFGSFKGKFVQFSTDYGNVEIYISAIIFIPENATFSGTNNVSVPYQPVTGHAAIPANTTITYLGQLGGGARIEVGSYVGTGKYGSSNACAIVCGFVPKLLVVYGTFGKDSSHYEKFSLPMVVQSGSYSYQVGGSFSISGTVKVSGNTVSFYANNAYAQGNVSGLTYHYVAIG